jgi:hypothetical protein
MRDFCVAVSAIIPLLLLTFAVEHRQAIRRMGEVMDAAMANKTPEERIEANAAFAERRTVLFGRALTVAVLAELLAVSSVPFAPGGAPSNVLWWMLLIGEVLVVALVMAYVIWHMRASIAFEYRNLPH